MRCCQLKKVSMDCSMTARPGPRQLGISGGTALCLAKYCLNSRSRVPSSFICLITWLKASRFLSLG